MSQPDFLKIYASDYGKGYGAVEILANVCYIALFIYGCFLFWASQHNPIALVGLLYIPIPALSIYVVRLILRAVFAWRDKIAHDLF